MHFGFSLCITDSYILLCVDLLLVSSFGLEHTWQERGVLAYLFELNCQLFNVLSGIFESRHVSMSHLLLLGLCFLDLHL